MQLLAGPSLLGSLPCGHGEGGVLPYLDARFRIVEDVNTLPAAARFPPRSTERVVQVLLFAMLSAVELLLSDWTAVTATIRFKEIDDVEYAVLVQVRALPTAPSEPFRPPPSQRAFHGGLAHPFGLLCCPSHHLTSVPSIS